MLLRRIVFVPARLSTYIRKGCVLFPNRNGSMSSYMVPQGVHHTLPCWNLKVVKSFCSAKSNDINLVVSKVIKQYKQEEYEGLISDAENYFQNIPSESSILSKEDFKSSLFKLSCLYLLSLKENGKLENLNKFSSKLLALGGSYDLRIMALWTCYAGYVSLEQLNSPSEKYLTASLDIIKSNFKNETEIHYYVTLPVYKGLTNIHYHKNDANEALKYARKALELGQSLEVDPLEKIHPLVDVLSQLAAIYIKKAKFIDAEEFYKKGLELCNLIKSRASRTAKCQILFGLSQIGVLTASLSTVQSYLMEYVSIMDEDNAPPSLNIARTYINLGISFLQQGKIEDALFNLERGREMAKIFNADVFVKHAESLIGKITERKEILSSIEKNSNIL